MKIKRLPILKFIERFKKGFDNQELVKVFTLGNCYHFALILKNIYQEGRIVHDNVLNHFMLEIDGRYYDITGEVKTDSRDKEYLDEMANRDLLHYQILMRDCKYLIDYFKGIPNEFVEE